MTSIGTLIAYVHASVIAGLEILYALSCIIIIPMNKFVLLAIMMIVALAVHEIPVKHKQKTPAEAKRFLRYLRKDTYLRQA